MYVIVKEEEEYRPEADDMEEDEDGIEWVCKILLGANFKHWNKLQFKPVYVVSNQLSKYFLSLKWYYIRGVSKMNFII